MFEKTSDQVSFVVPETSVFLDSTSDSNDGWYRRWNTLHEIKGTGSPRRIYSIHLSMSPSCDVIKSLYYRFPLKYHHLYVRHMFLMTRGEIFLHSGSRRMVEVPHIFPVSCNVYDDFNSIPLHFIIRLTGSLSTSFWKIKTVQWTYGGCWGPKKKGWLDRSLR